MLSIFEISTSALAAERLRIQAIANNMANADNLNGGGVDRNGDAIPYRRRQVRFQLGIPGRSAAEGVSVGSIGEDPTPFRLVYDPSHPDAVKAEGPEKGYVRHPNVSHTMEMVDLMQASRAYEANITAIETTRSMLQSAMRILA